MKKFLSILISVLLFFVLLGTLLLGIVRKNVSGSTITNLAVELMKPVAMETHNNGLYYPDEGKIVSVVQYDYNDFDFSNLDLTNLDINALVNEYCEAAGIDVDADFISEVLADPQTSKFVDKYVTEITEYAAGVKTELKINPVDVQNVINNAIDKYEIKTGEKVDRTGLNENIAAVVEESAPSITAAIDEVKEENAESFEQAKIVIQLLSLKVFLICIAVCAVLALLILLINKNVFTWFKYISIPAIIAGALIFIAGIVLNGIMPALEQQLFAQLEFELPLSFVKAVETIVLNILKQIKITGAISTLSGVILLVLGITLGNKNK